MLNKVLVIFRKILRRFCSVLLICILTAAACGGLKQYDLEIFEGIIYRLTGSEYYKGNSKILLDLYNNQPKKLVDLIKYYIARREFERYFVDIEGVKEKDEEKINEKINYLEEIVSSPQLYAQYTEKVNQRRTFEHDLLIKGLRVYQTDDWHYRFFNKLDYSRCKYDLNKLFLNKNIDTLSLNDLTKYAEIDYSTCVVDLIDTEKIYSEDEQINFLPDFSSHKISYEKYRFLNEKWEKLLQIHYQDYYVHEIKEEVHTKLLGMSYLLNSYLNKKDKELMFDSISSPARQLQDWTAGTAWKTNFKMNWEYKMFDPKDENDLPEPVNKDFFDVDSLNEPFFNSRSFDYFDAEDNYYLTRSKRDSLFYLSGYNGVNNFDGKKYKDEADKETNAIWLETKPAAGEAQRYFRDDPYKIFTFILPIYLIDVVNNYHIGGKKIKIDQVVLGEWMAKNGVNGSISSDIAKEYVRNLSDEEKERILYWMFYEIADKNDEVASKKLFRKYIPASEIKETKLWGEVEKYYPEDDKKSDWWWWLPWKKPWEK